MEQQVPVQTCPAQLLRLQTIGQANPLCQSNPHDSLLCVHLICLQPRTCTVAIMVAMYTPAVKGSRGISDSTRLARTSLPTCRAESPGAS